MKITLVENFRALFYAPFYAALELGAFRAEGLDVEMASPSGSRQAMEYLASGEAHVAWGGPMRVMLALDRDPAAGTVAFCEVVGRDPFFLLGREAKPDFAFADLLGRRVATVSEVPTPWVCLQQDLRAAGIDPASLDRRTGATMAENVEALRAGTVDVIQVFEPFATRLQQEGAAHVWHAAASRGLACYTTFNTTRAFLAEHPEVALGFARAMYRSQKWIFAHDAQTLAECIGHYLRDVSPELLSSCCDVYKTGGVWSRQPLVQRAGIEYKRDAMHAAGAIKTPLAYEDYVDNLFAEEAVRQDPPSL